MAKTKTGFAWDERFMWHYPLNPGGHLMASGWIEPYQAHQRPDTKRRFKNLVEVSGLLDKLIPIKARQATYAELQYFHTKEYIERVRTLSAGLGGVVGLGTSFGTGGFEIAALAVGALIETVDGVLEGKYDNAYAVLRPSGHHARRDSGLGSCIFGNVTIAAMHARKVRNIPRVAIIDFDVHHGNGAQEAFYDDPTVFTISIHQRGWYTMKGEIEERGEGKGEGFNLNVPLPAGCGDGAYEAAFERVIVPALRRFKPDLILVAAGYDAGAYDPTSAMMVSTEGFRAIADMLVAAAGELCNRRIVMEQEGGYNPSVTPFSALAVLESVCGIRTGIEDPHQALIKDSPDHALQPHQDEVIRKAQAAFGL